MQILRILLAVVVIAFVGWLGYFYYQNNRLPTLDELTASAQGIPALFSEKVPLDTASLPQLPAENQQALTAAIEQGKERVDMVLGEAIEVASESDKPPAQKAIDYGRYLYCQQVVEEYEAAK